MTQADQFRDDLSFVRAAVARRDESPLRFQRVYYIWAAYILIGYTLIDFNTVWANWFFAAAWVPAVVMIGITRRVWTRRHGECDQSMARKMKLHFGVGGLLSVAAVMGLAICIPGFRGTLPGQVAVVLFGMVYFLAGVHLDRSFLWLGPILIAGGILVGLVPHYGWTALGVVIAAGLCAAAMLNARRQQRETAS